MRERSKTYLKHCYELSTSALYWTAIIGVVYVNVLYHHVYSNDNTYDT